VRVTSRGVWQVPVWSWYDTKRNNSQTGLSPAQPSPAQPSSETASESPVLGGDQYASLPSPQNQEAKARESFQPCFHFFFFFHFFFTFVKKKTEKPKKERRPKKAVSQGYRSCSYVPCLRYLSRKVDPSIRSMGLPSINISPGTYQLIPCYATVLVFGWERLDVGIEGRDVRPIIRAYLCLSYKQNYTGPSTPRVWSWMGRSNGWGIFCQIF